MLKRKIEKKLKDWKAAENRKPLIIKGCRQCGKTFSVLNFAKKNYKHVVYLNFYENPDYASVFAGALDVDTIVMMLSALLGREAVFESGSTVLILDEIQECPEARTALKFFRTDGRYDVIGTGSLPAEEMSGKGNACSGGSAQPHETAASAIRGCRRHAGRRADLCGHKADGRSAADPEGYCPLL